MNTWIAGAAASGFSIENLPYCIFSVKSQSPRLGMAIGNELLDLHQFSSLGFFNDIIKANDVFGQPFLNDFIALGKDTTNAVRAKVQEVLCDPGQQSIIEDAGALIAQQEATYHLPVRIGDYTDFYSSEGHAANVGKMFRDPANALPVNWKHLPVGYHGRASSIVISGTPIHRPRGQSLPKGESTPIFGPSTQMDFELETAFVIGKESNLGDPIPVDEAERYIFGLCLFNDWSARDHQRWEYVPLGPFLGKNFGSVMSPFIVPIEALEPFKKPLAMQEPVPLSYLTGSALYTYDIELTVSLIPEGGPETRLAVTNFNQLYWSMGQQLAHHTIGGCNVKIGDLMASGTISGKEPGSFGSMLELSWSGQQPILINGGGTRTFLQDNDTIVMRGVATANGVSVSFGELWSTLRPAK